ncbi:MAG TPA: sulfite oxidase, partial [Gemmataceae bacterium]|nr:sulfite oxidase [Gemmataceae bacterium]
MNTTRAAGLSRRAFLGGAAALPLLSAADGAEPAEAPRPAQGIPGIIVRQTQPDNLEFPFASLRSFLTPNEQFYVRTHFEVPKLEAKSWRLKVGGAVEKPAEITYDELRKLPSRTVPALLECSGNSRVLLRPPQLGIRWEQGGVSNAEWRGVPLSAVLERAGVRDRAVEVILEGADRGELRPPNPPSPGVISYARSLPLAKARRPEVLLAYQMNGKDLPPEHGFPVRAVVPGWYGMASVKWLARLVVTERPFHGYFHTFMYSVWERRDGEPTLAAVSEIQVKSQIARPVRNEVVAAGSRYRIFGAAWGGEAQVARVEVSTDGGKEWQHARLLDRPVPYTW